MLSLLTMVGRLISTENPVVCIHFLFPLSIISLIFSVHQFGKGGNPNSVLCGPVCGFGGQVGERHHRSPRPALLKPCEPVVSSSCQRQLPREALEYEVLSGENSNKRGREQAEKQTQQGPQRQRIGARDNFDGCRILPN